MEFKTKITAIGDSALTKEDQLIVLFGETVTDDLAKASLQQTFLDPSSQKDFVVEAGKNISIGDKSYKINYVGSLVEENMRSIGHVNFIFDSSEHTLASAIYLEGKMDPSIIKLGTIITYNN